MCVCAKVSHHKVVFLSTHSLNATVAVLCFHMRHATGTCMPVYSKPLTVYVSTLHYYMHCDKPTYTLNSFSCILFGHVEHLYSEEKACQNAHISCTFNDKWG